MCKVSSSTAASESTGACAQGMTVDGGRREVSALAGIGPHAPQAVEDMVAEPFELFVCQICLDIAFKPIVLQGCGHVFCFWCVRRSMNDRKPSHCPACRRAYLHFPRVCRLLHFLLQKAWSGPYRRKASEVDAMEQTKAIFSPRILPLRISHSSSSSSSSGACHRQGDDDELEGRNRAADSSNAGSGNDEEPAMEGARMLHVYPEGVVEAAEMAVTISVEDVACRGCRRLLFRPVVINCGEVLCEWCWQRESQGRREVGGSTPACCRWCGGVHQSGGQVRVCLPLHHFLEKTFPNLYSQRARHTTHPLPTVPTPTTDGTKKNEVHDVDEEMDEEDAFVHVGVGCDGCGMFPIVSRNRYHCLECGEHVGYDLCHSCYVMHIYNASKGSIQRSGVGEDAQSDKEGCKETQGSPTSVLLNTSVGGRFDQRHNAQHEMMLVTSTQKGSSAIFNSVPRSFESRNTPLQFDIQNGTIARRRRTHQQIMEDFDDYIDSLV